MGKGLLIIILGSMMIMTVVSMTFVQTTTLGIDNAVDHYEDLQARNLGNSMMNFLLTRLANDMRYRLVDSEEKNYGSTNLDFTVTDTTFVAGDSLIKIQVNVVYFRYPDYITKTITAYSRPSLAAGWVPPVVRGAWTANGDLNNTISDMYIDGRDHDLNLNLIPQTGTSGVSSSVAFNNVENAAIGGTYDSVDYMLQYPENPNVIEEFYDWEGTFPETPDEILAYPDGALKSVAQSGVNGSQYFLNPPYSGSKNVIDFTNQNFPFQGVTYIELTDGVQRELVMEGFGHKGILVIHGPNRSSKLRGLKIDTGVKAKKVNKDDPIVFCHHPGEVDEESLSTDDEDELQDHLDHGDMLDDCPNVDGGWFEGLIITDYSFHHHLNILGAMLQLSPFLETDKNCNGNKEHWVKFSREAIEVATEFVAEETRLLGNSYSVRFGVNGGGFGPGRQKANYYFE